MPPPADLRKRSAERAKQESQVEEKNEHLTMATQTAFALGSVALLGLTYYGVKKYRSAEEQQATTSEPKASNLPGEDADARSALEDKVVSTFNKAEEIIDRVNGLLEDFNLLQEVKCELDQTSMKNFLTLGEIENKYKKSIEDLGGVSKSDDLPKLKNFLKRVKILEPGLRKDIAPHIKHCANICLEEARATIEDAEKSKKNQHILLDNFKKELETYRNIISQEPSDLSFKTFYWFKGRVRRLLNQEPDF